MAPTAMWRRREAMWFGAIPVDECVGTILAHGLKADGLRLRKGQRLLPDDAARLRRAGIDSVIALRLDPGDEPEDIAAARLGAALAAPCVSVGEATTGRVNLYATASGLFRVDRAAVDRFNRVDPAITFACLADRSPVVDGEMVGTIKIIPLAVAGTSLDQAADLIAQRDFLQVKPFGARRVGLVATRLPTLKDSVMDKTRALLQARLDPSGSRLVAEERVPHDQSAVADALRRMARDVDLLVVFGASAVADPADVIPAAIAAAGGHIEAVGMPVDPGNLLVLGELESIPVIGAPGCARSPKENGFDWILARILAGEDVTRDDITAMGVGGLLMEIRSRPQPRSEPAIAPRKVEVEAVMLAAGRASRMGKDGAHKLLAEFDGVPLVRRLALSALAAPFSQVVVVTGHRSADIQAVLAGLGCRIVFNPDYADGMASSLAVGIGAVSPDADGALILLADMPRIATSHLERLVDAFRKAGGKAIVRAVSGERRGNPVILPRATFAAILKLEGDVGARQIVETSGLEIVDVDIGEASQIDVDTADAVLAAGGLLRD
jgi:molybdenum cofactor cytidylyltransferase